MREDLTLDFQNEITRIGRAPVQLLAFNFPVAGVVRVSDRDLGPADGLTDTWSGLVENWGTLQDVTAADPSEVSIEARQLSITLLDRGDSPFSHYFLKESPENVTADLYQWFYGLDQADLVLIDRFVVADPIRYGERGRLVTLDLVSSVVNMDSIVGGLLSAADWPNAKEDDVGKPIDVLIGNCGRVPTICARTAPSASLSGSILAATTLLLINEDLDVLGFSAAGTLQVEEELIRYSSRTQYAFNVSQRGYLSTASEHLDRVEVVELITDHTFFVGRGPVQSINAVQVGGYPAIAGTYSVDPSTDPAKVIFNQKPYAYRFAAGSSFLAMQFDAINADNTAYQAYKAYDAGDDATAAKINENYRTLSLKQATVNPDRGAIVKAYLAVEHWESNKIINDFCDVWVEGVGVIGRLSRPNQDEGITIDADVDIDHGHSHAIGGEHTHTFYDPVLQTSEEVHTHLTEDTGTESSYSPDSGDEAFTLTAPKDEGEFGEQKWVYFHGVPTRWSSAKIKFYVNLGGARLKVGAYYWAVDGLNTLQLGSRNSSSTTYTMSFQAYGDGVYYAEASIWDISLKVITETIVLGAETGANTSVAISGRNASITSDKKTNDVQNLATDNATVNINATAASTQSYVNLFDLTQYVNFSWSWFTDRDVKVIYQGSIDNESVYILHCFFDVEYRKKEVFFSDDVTAETTGLIDDATGTYTGTPGALITRPDHVLKRLLAGFGQYPIDSIDDESFDDTGGRLAVKGYTVDGVLRGDTTIKEALKKIAFQSRTRPFFSAGLAKCRFVEALDDWIYSKEILPDNYQLNSIAIERQPVQSITNQIDLFFARDWTNDETGPAGFASSVRSTHAKSIERFGIKNNPDRFLFDLVRSAAMAQDLAQYYVNRLCFPSAFYTINGYLPWFPLEKEDKVKLTANFNRLKKAPMRVLSVNRFFGSGKNQALNHVSLLLESLRYILIDETAADMVSLLDALNAEIGLYGTFSESIHIGDLETLLIETTQAEDIIMSDDLSTEALFLPFENESISISDALIPNINIVIDDPVNFLDDCDGWRQFGFGGGKFGVVGFGGWIVWYNRSPDEIAAFDLLTVDLTYGTIQEDISVEEVLYMHSGFGCPVGSGYGATPFGL